MATAPLTLPPLNLSGGAGGSAGPSNAAGGAYGSGMDGSAWNVNFSGIQSASSAQDKSSGGGLLPPMAGNIPWYVWAGVAAVVVWRLKKSRR